ncbi:MAG TPA: RluA family pseudouridine synthase [Candidatus Polarisedimenticolia bacterium]|nr:RluA family pseudouridine synthase [Candidatus Polarisedimenticolia bacterium]
MEDGDSTIDTMIADAQAGMRLDRALADLLPDLSRERVKALILGGHVRRKDGEAARDPSTKVRAGLRYAVVVPPPQPADAQPQAIALSIVHEDSHLIVIDKAAGMVVHPAAGNLDGTLVNALLSHCEGQLSGIGGVARPGIVHRIDKDTTGLLVVAKTDKAHEGLARQFKDHSISRRYLAIVNGIPDRASGTVDSWMGRSDSDRKKMAVQPEGRGRRAVTHYRVMTRLDRAALVECRLETGRTHQVRVHMAHLGHPLLGDPAYARGQNRHRELLAELGFRRQALHATHLGFIHPVDGTDLEFDSPMPSDMQELFSHLNV